MAITEQQVQSNPGMAVWCALRQGGTPTTIEAHFNLWRITGDEEFRRKTRNRAKDFLDIGIMLDDPRQVDQVFIYVPEPPNAISIEDCAPYLAKPHIAQGIFNEVLSTRVDARPGPRSVELTSDTGVFCRVHEFLKSDNGIDSSQLSVEQIASGALLTIKRLAVDESSSPDSTDRAYFRIRVSFRSAIGNPFVSQISTPDRLFQSGVEELEFIDFRLNEARTLPQAVESRMRAGNASGSIALRFVAFLTAVPVESELSESNARFHKLRVLEHSLWKDYVPSGIPLQMVVYHWRGGKSRKDYESEPRAVADFSAFVKLRTRRSGRQTLYKYLGVAFLFGIAGNLAASAIQAGATAVWSAVVKSRSVAQTSPLATPAPGVKP